MVEVARGHKPLLRDRVLAMVRQAPRPLTGLQILREMRADGNPMHDSQIYRALQQLCRDGALRKIHLWSGYAPGGATERISLLCRNCRSVTSIEAPEVIQALERLASRDGLVIMSFVVEVPGHCAGCLPEQPLSTGELLQQHSEPRYPAEISIDLA